MQSEALKKLILDSIEEMKGKDITCLDVSELTSVTDHMIIVSGTSNRHVKSVADGIIMDCKKAGVRPLGTEGQDKADWVLVDLGDVVVHVMLPAARAFYDLERLWDHSQQEETASEQV